MQYSHSFFLKSLHLDLSACLWFILGHPLDYNAFIYNNNARKSLFRNVYKQWTLNNGSKIKPSNFTQQFPSTHCPSSLTISLRPESSPWALGQRRVFVLTCEFQQPPASCVSPMACCTPPVSVCVCVWERTCCPKPGVGFNLTWFRDTFTCKNALSCVSLPLTGFTCGSFCF